MPNFDEAEWGNLNTTGRSELVAGSKLQVVNHTGATTPGLAASQAAAAKFVSPQF